MLPFRSHPGPPLLRKGYVLLQESHPCVNSLNRLLASSLEGPRSVERWQRVLERSAWHLGVSDPTGRLVGFVRATTDQALNANLWDLMADPADPFRSEVLSVLVQAALTRLRKEAGGCSISVSAGPEALDALSRAGFVVDPGGIRAMGKRLGQS